MIPDLSCQIYFESVHYCVILIKIVWYTAYTL